MGDLIADWYSQWAWDEDHIKFDDWDLNYDDSVDIYLKSEIAEHFQDITPSAVSDLDEDDLSGDLTVEMAESEIR